ncbi:putative cytochrome p450 protein [Neofusicoccum parvum UCRNP2]|uniref:Putative cytochrome p450 protein n=1 Tax=Botryosphaeria parva (strain UCR-NP2) TaxID=1287680 RepID=R1G988_BOTPV|nr:putative cytochrome p450 protein [Neofusicoccum parvum UCRNP2]
MFSPLLVAGGLIALFALSVVFYNLFLHPLRKYPGPWYARATIFWSQYHSFKGDLTFHVHAFHQKYGPVVRVAPNELVYTDPQAWKDIYGHRNGVPENEKDPANNADPDPAHLSIIRADRQHHSKLRRLLSHAFSEKSMQSQEPVIKSYIDLLIERLRKTAEKGDPQGTDIVRWYNFTTFDIIGHLAFAESFGCLANCEYHPWIEAMFSAIKYGVMMAALRRVQDNLAGIVVNLIPERIRKQRAEIFSVTDELVLRRRETAPAYTDFLTHLVQAEKDGKLELADVIAQGPVIVVAGSETTATLLSGGTFYLLTHPLVYARVVDEIRTHFKDQSEITLASITGLKYLLAFFDEALRMYPPAGANQARVTPPQGAQICGEWVPGGTFVGIHQYAQFRSPRNFSEPDVFAPERWMETGDPRWEGDRRDALQPFSFGPRNCIGRNLAYVEMRLILATILWNFDMEIVPGQDRWSDQKIFAVWEKSPLMLVFDIHDLLVNAGIHNAAGSIRHLPHFLQQFLTEPFHALVDKLLQL